MDRPLVASGVAGPVTISIGRNQWLSAWAALRATTPFSGRLPEVRSEPAEARGASHPEALRAWNGRINQTEVLPNCHRICIRSGSSHFRAPFIVSEDRKS